MDYKKIKEMAKVNPEVKQAVNALYLGRVDAIRAKKGSDHPDEACAKGEIRRNAEHAIRYLDEVEQRIALIDEVHALIGKYKLRMSGITNKEKPLHWDYNNGVLALYDAFGACWIRRFYKEEKYELARLGEELRRLKLKEGAPVPFSG